MQKKNCCPFSYDPKEAQTQILVILLQIRSTPSTWVEMKIKLVLHVSPLLITPHDKAQGLFLITLDVKPAVLCAGGLMKAASLQFEIPPPSSSPLQNVVQSHWAITSFLQYQQGPHGPHILHHPSKQGPLMLWVLRTHPSLFTQPFIQWESQKIFEI